MFNINRVSINTITVSSEYICTLYVHPSLSPKRYDVCSRSSSGLEEFHPKPPLPCLAQTEGEKILIHVHVLTTEGLG